MSKQRIQRYERADGYVVVWHDDRRWLEHRLVMTQHLGRELRLGEVVHHLNGARNDNRAENLHVAGSQSEHVSEHHGSPCVDGCGCGRHRPYERTPEHRRTMSETIKQVPRTRGRDGRYAQREPLDGRA